MPKDNVQVPIWDPVSTQTLLCHQMKVTYSNFQLRHQLSVEEESFSFLPKEKKAGEWNCHLVLI